MIQEHLDEQEHIWNTSGHLEQHRTGHHHQTWHNWTDSFKSMALQVLPDTHPNRHLSTKNEHCSGTPSMGAPTPKKPKFSQLTLTQCNTSRLP